MRLKGILIGPNDGSDDESVNIKRMKNVCFLMIVICSFFIFL